MLRGGGSRLVRSSATGTFLPRPAFLGCRQRRSIGGVGGIAPPRRRPFLRSPVVFSTSPSSPPASSDSESRGGGPSLDWLRRDLAIVLVHPQIPQNAGSAARTAAATRIPLHLVGPLGFEVEDKRLKRAGLDYWHSVCLEVWPDWDAFVEGVSSSSPRFVAFSKRGGTHYATPGVYGAPTPANPTFLLFGAETSGLPPEAHRASAAVVRLPIEQKLVRSLNLAVSVGVGCYEALRQVDGVKELPEIRE